MFEGSLNVFLVQQGVWDMPLESMPLASAYLKAMVLADQELRQRASVEIRNFRGKMTHAEMAFVLFAEKIPDVLAFSVLGWNVRAFGALAATFKLINPQGWVVFGGTHVTGQAEKVFRENPDVDVVVNGEGEVTFRELVRAITHGASKTDLGQVQGISWHEADGTVVANSDRPRIEDFDIIPSPLLTGALELVDGRGRFRYDVALIETNRGCPYKCSFCYWGGAVGQRVRAFSRERLRAEMELLAKLRVHTVVACDSNFGMLPIDLEFVDDLIQIKQEHGFPLAFETSWAKNKSKVFYEIVRRMKRAGLRSSFTLALQTLNPDALDAMNRRNMKLNDWQDLVQWLSQEGLDCYAELIWGAPGETAESFLEGYNKLAQHVSRIAVYPLLLLPNTDYFEKKEQHGIIALRGDHDDYEYVLTHRTMSFESNRRMLRFMFWARVIGENAVLRHSWLPLRVLAGWEQSTILLGMADWADATECPQATPLREAAAHAHGGGAPAYAAAIGYLFTDPSGREALECWWEETVVPRLKPEHRAFLTQVFQYDLLTQPICPPPGSRKSAGPSSLPPLMTVAGEQYYVREGVLLTHDVPALLAALRAGEAVDPSPAPTRVDLYYRVGALNAVLSTNHEEIMHFMGELRPHGRTTSEVPSSRTTAVDSCDVTEFGEAGERHNQS
jgi:radical SAM superfamily enzyme YgiQ (UPF0313 family)